MITRRDYLKGTTALAASAALGLKLKIANAATRMTNELSVGVQSIAPLLDPLRLQTNNLLQVAYSIYDFPIRTDYKNGGARVPGLARSWKMLNSNTMEISFRSGVLFHNGEEMTSEDVAFSLGPKRMGPNLPGSGLATQYFSVIDHVEIVDRYTVRITTKTPDPLLEYRLAGWGSQIISKSAFEKVGDWDKWAKAPIGTGPYRVVEFRNNDVLRLVAHEKYWGGKPPHAALTFHVVPESVGRVNGLLAGDYDIVSDVSPDQISQIESSRRAKVVGGSTQNTRVITFDSTEGPMRDPRVRRALNLAIDRNLIANALYGGRVSVPNGFQWKAYGDMYIADYKAPGFDPQLARRLLQESGYKGEPIVYRSQTNYYTAEIQTAQILVDMWKKVGLNVNLQIVENWDQVWKKPNGGIFNGSINMIYPDALGTVWPLYGPTGFIRTTAHAWSDSNFDAIGKTLLTLENRDQRRNYHREILDIFSTQNPPGAVLHESGMFFGKRSEINWTPYRLPYIDFGPFNA